MNLEHSTVCAKKDIIAKCTPFIYTRLRFLIQYGCMNKCFIRTAPAAETQCKRLRLLSVQLFISHSYSVVLFPSILLPSIMRRQLALFKLLKVGSFGV